MENFELFSDYPVKESLVQERLVNAIFREDPVDDKVNIELPADGTNFLPNEARIFPPRGMTPMDATRYMRQAFPGQPHWICWDTREMPASVFLQEFIDSPQTQQGAISGWSWRRIPCSYPESIKWVEREIKGKRKFQKYWTGALEVSGHKGESFILFSYMDGAARIGDSFMVSCPDLDAPYRFATDLELALRPKPKSDVLTIEVPLQRDNILLKLDEKEHVCLEDGRLHEIEEQCLSFFEDREAYAKWGVAYKRGFLFVGPPGTGKTMTIRHIARTVCRKRKIPILAVLSADKVEDSQLAKVFEQAVYQAPSIVILEELDSLTRESKCTRSGVLNLLDGLSSNEGVLVLATSNNPGDIDPALVHRPSRFDRVWRFELPSQALRLRYLKDQFTGHSSENLEKIACRSDGWSYAYLKELWNTAALLTIRAKGDEISTETLNQAFRLLASQFDAGRNNQVFPDMTRALGFVNN